MGNTNHAYILWVDGKPSKISSDKRCLAIHANQANQDGLSVDVTHHHTSRQEAYDILLAGNSFDEYMNEANPNRFIKSSFALSLLWVAKFYSVISMQYPELSGCKDCSNTYTSRAMFALKRCLTGYFNSLPNTYGYIHLTY